MVWGFSLLALLVGVGVAAAFSVRQIARVRKQHARQMQAIEATIKDKTLSLETMLDIIVGSASSNRNNITQMMQQLFEDTSTLAQNSANSLTIIANNMQESQGLVGQLADDMIELQTKAGTGAEVAASLNEALSEFRETSSRLGSIQTQMGSIQEKANAIKSVGQDAEMLALNAAIEAARAGEMGRGFAVVADSMKSLAKSSQAMTDEIQAVLDSSHEDINEITDSITNRSEVLLDKTHALVDTYHEVTGTIDTVGEHVEQLDHDFTQVQDVVHKETESTRTSMETLVRELTITANRTSGLEIVDLSPQQAKSQLDRFDYLIDVRRPDEYDDELGHIPGTELITLQTDFPERVKQFPKDKKYLFICRSGGRSTKAAQQALMQDIRDVSNLDGGMLAWRKAGY
jgi:methyl-accepting chemotaxis protein